MTIINLPFIMKSPVLALGANSKNRICFAKGSKAYLSNMHENLDNIDDLSEFEKSAKSALSRKPKIIACDLHSGYLSSRYADEISEGNLLKKPIQHHHAHIASCMAENQFKNEYVIGVAFDGTGLGVDGNIWGAEFLFCNYANFQRLIRLEYIPLLGSEKAITEPARLAYLWLYLIYKDRFLDIKINLTQALKPKKWAVFKKMYSSGFNSPKASSMGRLFDAVASIVLGKQKAEFEADLAIQLQRLAEKSSDVQAAYKFSFVKQPPLFVIDPRDIFKGVVKDTTSGLPAGYIANRFHYTIASIILEGAEKIRKIKKANKVVLSGGVFQNSLLLRMTLELLYKKGFKVYTHKALSPNDSSIALGQAVIANFKE
ncbi:MAG: carbamoyltransferase HypF [Candidatus Omnitrophota bacterium]|jgi:hydrogenase maturation protein HypF|nr:MAG: carbamoyltransferase HypF [Candidatus Omnitrophota bacterium]